MDEGSETLRILSIEGMTCAACSARLEKVLGRIPGVKATVNLAREEALVESEAPIPLAKLAETVRKAGYRVAPARHRFTVTGLSERSDAIRLKRLFSSREGLEADVTFPEGNLVLSVSAEAVIPLGDAVQRIRKAGFAIEALDDAGIPARPAARRKEALWLVLSFAATVPLWVDMPAMFTTWAKGKGHSMGLPLWLAWGLSTFVQWGPGFRFLRGAWNSLRGGSANMDVLVALGSLAAWALGTWGAWAHRSELFFFEAGPSVITMVLLGKWWESGTRRRGQDALASYFRRMPVEVPVRRGDDWETSPVGRVVAGDLIRVAAGEAIPVDGVVQGEATLVDESSLSGESLPVRKSEGDAVWAGTVNGESPLQIRATTAGSRSRVFEMARKAGRASLNKSPAAKLADRVIAVFVPVVTALSFVTFLAWWFVTGSVDRAWFPAIAVLVVACPCALGLAAPAALWLSGHRALLGGFFFKDSDSLRKSAELRVLFVDKTGTLTNGRPEVQWRPASGIELRELQEIAYALSFSTRHPLSQAILRSAGNAPSGSTEIASVRSLSGKGILAKRGKDEIRLGSAAFLAESGIVLPSPPEGAGAGVSGVIVGTRFLGWILFVDALRPEAFSAVASLRSLGIEVRLASGDRVEAVQPIAEALGVPWHAGLSPEDKIALVRSVASDRPAGMAGDGVNDALALAGAHVGFAMGEGSGAALEHADVVLSASDLGAIARAVRLARATRARMNENLAFAFGYNLLALPLAAFGLLHPALAATAMALSSVSVMANSARLLRFR